MRILIGAIVVIVIILVGGYFILKPQISPVVTPNIVQITPNPSSPAEASTSARLTYISNKYGFTLNYPSDLPAFNGSAKNAAEVDKNLETVETVDFGCNGFGVGVCDPQFRFGPTSLKTDQINTILNLPINGRTDKSTTYDLGGMWNQKTNYTKLPDEKTNGVTMAVLDNPSGYDGSSRIWFYNNKGEVLQFTCRYINQEMLKQCQTIMASFKSLN